MTRIIRLLSLAVLLALTAACSSLPPVSAKPANYIV
ncbi:MAG: hypothetical protein K0S16_176, partial [Moraxellaceae bacterium]|nr:hypothetical protein [Moraxellaceae bacterium]